MRNSSNTSSFSHAVGRLSASSSRLCHNGGKNDDQPPNEDFPVPVDWRLNKFQNRRRRSLSPISRLVDILPEEAFDDKEEKASLATMGQTPTSAAAAAERSQPEKLVAASSEDAPNKNDGTAAEKNDVNNLINKNLRPAMYSGIRSRRNRLSVSNRIESMLKNSAEEKPADEKG